MSKQDANPEVQEEGEAMPDTSAPNSTNLTIQDLTTAMQIITVISARGAFKPEELGVVGNLYTKIHAFLDASGALAPATDSTTVESTAKDGKPAA